MSEVTRKLPPIVVVLILPEAAARRASSGASVFEVSSPTRCDRSQAMVAARAPSRG